MPTLVALILRIYHPLNMRTLRARADMLREDTWLGATSVHSRDPRVPALLHSLRELCDANPALRLVINHFDPNASSRVKARPATDRIQVSWVPGMKGLFWKTVLTPLRTSTYRVVWLFDSDMAVHPSVLPLGTIVRTLLATNASLLQPAIRSAGGETQHTWRVCALEPRSRQILTSTPQHRLPRGTGFGHEQRT